MPRRFALATLLIPLVAGLISVGAGAASASKPEIQQGNGHGHEYPVKGSSSPRTGHSNLINHGGPVLTSSPLTQGTPVTAIFWGTSWNNSSFAGDKVIGLDSFYTGWSNSGYSTTTTEYTGSNGTVTGNVSNYSHVIDTSAGPTSPPTTAAIAAEVVKVVGTPVAGGYYPVYVDLKRGTAGYCAWHDTYVNNVQFEVGFFFNLDNDSGCDPKDTIHDEPLAALANVSGHELSEAKTDPQLNAWFDRQGYENADKCAWTFNKVSYFPSNQTYWKIQGNWSNKVSGCIDGN